MKRLIFLVLLFVSCATQAAVTLPPEIVGIWALDGAEFSDHVLEKGIALYLEPDGSGASIASDGRVATGVKVVVTSFNPFTNLIKADFIENGKVVAKGAMTYFPAEKVIVSAKDIRQRYQRRFAEIPLELKKSMGLEGAEESAK